MNNKLIYYCNLYCKLVIVKKYCMVNETFIHLSTHLAPVFAFHMLYCSQDDHYVHAGDSRDRIIDVHVC